jgi:hypothetical protein
MKVPGIKVIIEGQIQKYLFYDIDTAIISVENIKDLPDFSRFVE